MRLSACDSWDAKVVRDEAEHFAVATAVPNSVDDCPGKESAPRQTNDALGPKFIHSLRRMSSRHMSHSSATTVDVIGLTSSLKPMATEPTDLRGGLDRFSAGRARLGWRRRVASRTPNTASREVCYLRQADGRRSGRPSA